MNYVNGKFYDRKDFASINPCTEEIIGHFPQSTKDEVTQAVEVARNAFKTWRTISRVNRAEYFDKLCQVLKNRTDEIVNLISLETGKSLNESRAEVIEALHMTQYTFGRGRTACGDIVASEIADKDAYVIRKPKGVVAVISPWNFPFAVGGFWCSAPSLLEGNTVVFKPSELTPAVGKMIAELYDAAGFPPGVFNLVHGDGKTGAFLVDEKVDHIAFTGSAEVGQHIRKVCASSWHKTCSCEMGSKSAVAVFDDCDFDLAVSASVNSALKLSGQRCVSSGRILIQRGIFNKFVDKFLEEIDKAILCDYRSVPDKSNYLTYGPLISREQMDKVIHYNEMVVADKDVKVYRTGRRAGDVGFFLTPTVYQCEWADKPFLKQEVFGPHVALIPFSTIEDAIQIYNDTDYGLALGIITNDFRKARMMREMCDFGLGYWNGGSIAAESHLPFGGVKKSGNGSPSGAGMFDAVVHKVAWTVNHGGLSFPQGMK